MSTGRLTKTLIDNWVEERQCQELNLDRDYHNEDGTLCTKLHHEGHEGILSNQDNTTIESYSTTVKSSYITPDQCPVRTVGKRKELLHQYVYDMVSKEVQEEIDTPTTTIEYTSVTKTDFTKDFIPLQIQPTTTHNMSEEPVTYWTENINHVTGVTQTTNKNSPFSCNAAFSTPIEHYLES